MVKNSEPFIPKLELDIHLNALTWFYAITKFYHEPPENKDRHFTYFFSGFALPPPLMATGWLFW